VERKERTRTSVSREVDARILEEVGSEKIGKGMVFFGEQEDGGVWSAFR
jgi:hypothetical protein